VRVNCEATVRLTRLFFRTWSSAGADGCWCCVHGELSAGHYLTTYAATKAFDRFFALGLAAEVARFGVNVTALCPGPTESEFFDVARSENFMPGGSNRGEVARIGIEALARGMRTIIPYFGGRFTAMLVRFCPPA